MKLSIGFLVPKRQLTSTTERHSHRSRESKGHSSAVFARASRVARGTQPANHPSLGRQMSADIHGWTDVVSYTRSAFGPPNQP